MTLFATMLGDMASDAIWTSLITGSTGVLTGFLGYGAARLQPMLEARRLGMERDRADRDSRRALYLEYLAAIDEVSRAHHDDTATPEWHSDWWNRFENVDNRLELLGSSQVRRASYPLYNRLTDLWNHVRREASRSGDQTYQQIYDTHFGRVQDSLTEHRREMVDAMRLDVQDEKSA